jgi:hypothetical protein
VADGRDGLVLVGEVADDLDQALIEAEVLGRAPAGDAERVVLRLVDVVEGGVEREVVATLLRVRLVALEVMDGGAHRLAGALARARGVDRVADGLQRLERDHDFVVLDEVADEHEDLLRHHAPR